MHLRTPYVCRGCGARGYQVSSVALEGRSLIPTKTSGRVSQSSGGDWFGVMRCCQVCRSRGIVVG